MSAATRLLPVLAFACPLAALGHGGAMDECGCHTDRTAGGYHCHRGQFANQTFRDKQEMLALLAPATKCSKELPPPACAPTLASAPEVRDHARTPGAINPKVTRDDICVPNWTKGVRPSTSYTDELKKRQICELGLPGTMSDYHEDHLVPLCVGGHPSDPHNLWPQPVAGKWTDKVKDQLESSVCRQVCRGDITRQQGQAIFLRNDWTRAWAKYFSRE